VVAAAPEQFIDVALNLAQQIRRALNPADIVMSLLIWATRPQSSSWSSR
jgi:hypothetical protein